MKDAFRAGQHVAFVVFLTAVVWFLFRFSQEIS